MPEAGQIDTGAPWASPSAPPPTTPVRPARAPDAAAPGSSPPGPIPPPSPGSVPGPSSSAARPGRSTVRRGPLRQRPIPLRPLTVLELVDGAVGAVPAVPRFLLVRAAGVTAASAAVALGATWWFNRTLGSLVQQHPTWGGTDFFGDQVTNFAPSDSERAALVTTEILIAVVCSGFAATVLAGLFAPSVKAYVDAEPADAEHVRALLRGRTARLFGLAALTTAPRLVPTLLFGLLARAAALDPAAHDGGWYFLVCVTCLPLCYLLTSLTAVAAPAAALEGAGLRAALRRSRRLAARGIFRVGWTCLFTLLIMGGATASLDLFGWQLRDQFGVGDQFAAVPGSPGLNWWLAVYILAYLLTLLLTTPYRAATATLLYVDRRFRREGLDIRIAWARLAHRPGANAGRPVGGGSAS